MSCLYACARPRRSPASSHSRSRRGCCAPPARPGTEAGATALGEHLSSPRPHGELGLAPLKRPTSVPCCASRPRPILPSFCRRFPECGAGRPESVPRGEGGEPCGPSPGHGSSDKPESGLPGFVWHLSGYRWGKRDLVLPLVFRCSPSPPRRWQAARAAPAVRRAQLPAWLQCAPCSSGAGKSPSQLLCGCCLTGVTAKMELLLYKKLIKRRT